MKHAFRFENEAESYRAVCSCGWRAIGRDKRPRGCEQAWAAHMYAQGFRTSRDLAHGDDQKLKAAA